MSSSIEKTIDKIFCKLDITDISLIRLMLNQHYLMGIVKAFDNAIQFHANNKDFFYTFKALPIKQEKVYNAHQILSLRKAYEEKRVSKDLMYYFIIENNNRRVIKLDLIDQLFLVFYISKYSYLKIYDAINMARTYRMDVKTFEFTYKPSVELYGELDNKVYSDKYLLLLYETSHHPIFISKFKELIYIRLPHLLKNN
jgi:hypothetical protein